MTDLLTQTRNMLTAQAEKRQAIIDREAQAQYWMTARAVPTGEYTTAPQTITEHEACNRLIVHGRTVLTRRRRKSQYLAAAKLPGYWGDHEWAVAQEYQRFYVDNCGISADSAAYDYQTCARLNAHSRLTAEQRNLIRWIRSSDAKHALAVAGVTMPENPVAVEYQTPTSSRLPKGIIKGTETRVNVRGAYGKRGIKGTMAQASQMDNRIPVWVLKNLPTVGVTTHPDASTPDADYITRTQGTRYSVVTLEPGETLSDYSARVAGAAQRLSACQHGNAQPDYSALLTHLRTHRKDCSLRLYTPDTPQGIVVPAHEYGKPEHEGRGAGAHSAKAKLHMKEADLIRYAATIGYTGNVQ